MSLIRNYSQAAVFTALGFLCSVSAAAGIQRGEIENIVVTATRTPVNADDVLAPVLVITREEIERSGALDLPQILRFHAGFDIGRNGGPGQTTSLFLRGTESNHTLVLIDGVRINPGTIGGAAIQNLSPALIERVEVVKGPRSTLYGTEAIGGVINVITRTRANRSATLEGSLTAGDYDTRSLSATGSLSGEAGSIGASAAHFDTAGFPTLAGSDINRGHRNTSVSVHGATRALATDIEFKHWQASGETEYLDFLAAPKQQNFANQATSLSVNADPGANWSTRAAFSYAVDDIEQQRSPDQVKTVRQVFDWQNNIALDSAKTLIAGITLTTDDVTALVFGLPTDERTRTAEIYAANTIDLDAHRFLFAARYTDHETFGSDVNANVEYGFDIAGSTRLTAGAGTGFRAPDATDLYGFGGNRDLDAEKSTNLELGLKHRIGARHTLSAGAFSNHIENLIEFNFDPVTFAGRNENVGNARIDGIELGYRFSGTDWTINSSAIFQDPQNESTGEVLPRRAKRSFTASVNRAFLDRYSVGLDVLATGRRKDSGFSETVNAGYVLANLVAKVNIAGGWQMQGRIENLLDTDYQTAAGFNTPGRGVYLTLRYRN